MADINKDIKWLGFLEQFSIKRKTIFKLINYAWILLVVILFFMGIAFIKNLIFPVKPISNVNTPVFNTGEGTNVNYTVVQQTEREQEKINVVPYVDANFGQNRSMGNWNQGETGWEVKAGVRIEFDGLFDWLFQRSNKAVQMVSKPVIE